MCNPQGLYNLVRDATPKLTQYTEAGKAVAAAALVHVHVNETYKPDGIRFEFASVYARQRSFYKDG